VRSHLPSRLALESCSSKRTVGDMSQKQIKQHATSATRSRKGILDQGRPDLSLFLYRPTDQLTGVARVFVTLANELAGEGVRVDLVTTGGPKASLASLDSCVRLVTLRVRKLRRAFTPLARYMAVERPRTLLSGMEHPNILAVAAARAAKVDSRVAVSCHGPLKARLEHVYGPREKLILPQLVRWWYPKADVIICASDGVRESLASYLPTSAEAKLTTVYNPVLSKDFASRANQDLPRWCGDSSDVPTIISAGRFSKEKSFSTLLAAFGRLREDRPARLVVLGDGPEKPSLEAAAAAMKLGSDVLMPGFISNPLPYMQRASVFVLSSILEGFGLVLVEAMACGTPVVATDCPGGPREVLADGKYGSLVPVEDPVHMASAIAETLDNPVDSKVLKARAEDFSAARVVDDFRRHLFRWGRQPA
jgi:glycosyltransferase involved in cell wall biosynthesis